MKRRHFTDVVSPVMLIIAGILLATWVVSAAASEPARAPVPGAGEPVAGAAAPTEAGVADPAGSDAAADAPETLLEYFLAGGPLMWVILGCSVVGLAFVIERCLNLRRTKTVDEDAYGRIMELVQEEDARRAGDYARENPGAMSRVLSSVLNCAHSPRAEMETVLEDAGARELWQLRRNTKPLGIIASVTPLLGLLGTVVGIIRAFRDVAMQEGAIGNPQMLANGIYEALITTAAGLTVAIPMLLFYHYFRGKAEDLVREMEEKSLHLIARIMHLRGEEAPAWGMEGAEQ